MESGLVSNEQVMEKLPRKAESRQFRAKVFSEEVVGVPQRGVN